MPDNAPDHVQEARAHIAATHAAFNRLHYLVTKWAIMSDSEGMTKVAREVDNLHHDFTDFLETGE